MGDSQGPWFETEVCGKWSTTETDLCLGKMSDRRVLGIRIGLGAVVGIIAILSSAWCYVIIRRPAKPPGRDAYAEIQSLEAHH
jgi:hypothetical protein